MEEKYMKIHPRSWAKAATILTTIFSIPMLMFSMLCQYFIRCNVNQNMSCQYPNFQISQMIYGFIVYSIVILLFVYVLSLAMVKLYNRFVSRI